MDGFYVEKAANEKLEAFQTVIFRWKGILQMSAMKSDGKHFFYVLKLPEREHNLSAYLFSYFFSYLAL